MMKLSNDNIMEDPSRSEMVLCIRSGRVSVIDSIKSIDKHRMSIKSINKHRMSIKKHGTK